MQHSQLKIEYEEFIAKHAFDLSSELLVSKYAMLFLLNFVTQTNFVPLPDPQTITSSLPIALYFYYNNDYKAVGVRSVFFCESRNNYSNLYFYCSEGNKNSKVVVGCQIADLCYFFYETRLFIKKQLFHKPHESGFCANVIT